MSDLTEFLLARVAHDEETSRSWTESLDVGSHELVDQLAWELCSRTLAECEAKRLRLVIADDLESEADDSTYRWAHSVAEQIRKADALAYADHPAYDEAWKP